jgi:hypothetical protein
MLGDSAFAKPFLPREDNVLHISLCVLRAWADFDETQHLNFSRKSVEKIQVSLKSDKNDGYFS